MGRLLKLFPDGAVKKCSGTVRGYTAEGNDQRFCIRIEAPRSRGFDGYVLRMSFAEANKLYYRLQAYLSTAPNPEEIALAREYGEAEQDK